MPFLVDSVSMALAEAEHDVHLVIHPQFVVRRDVGRPPRWRCSTSTPATDAARRRPRVLDAPGDRPDRRRGDRPDRPSSWTRCSPTCATPSRTGSRMHAQVDSARRPSSRQHPPPLPDERARAGRRRSCAGWATTTSPSSATASTAWSAAGDGEALVGRARHRLRHPARRPGGAAACCPTAVAAQARDKHLLVLAKANSKATVHRPVYLDYVGVKKFDEDGEVVGERRFLGPVLLGRLHRVGEPDPGAAREGRRR